MYRQFMHDPDQEALVTDVNNDDSSPQRLAYAKLEQLMRGESIDPEGFIDTDRFMAILPYYGRLDWKQFLSHIAKLRRGMESVNYHKVTFVGLERPGLLCVQYRSACMMGGVPVGQIACDWVTFKQGRITELLVLTDRTSSHTPLPGQH